MNKFYILAVILTAVAALGWVVAIFETENPSPQSGDKRIVKSADRFYLERYRKYPAWERIGLEFNNEEAAMKSLAEYDKLFEEVIFPAKQ